MAHGFHRLGGPWVVLLLRADRAQHDRARPEPKLRVSYGPFRARHDHLRLEAEHAREPVDGGRTVFVLEGGKDVGGVVVRRWIHGSSYRQGPRDPCI